MNTIKKIQIILITLVGLMTINSCVKDDDWSLPPVECNESWDTDMTMEELFNMVDAADGEILSFDTERVLEGYVVSKDSTGNFFKTVSIQNDPTNPTRGLQVEMDRTNLFNEFPLGAKIKVNLKGLNVGYDRGMLKIGQNYTDGNGNLRVGRMAEIMIDGHVVKSCEQGEAIAPVVFSNIQAAISSGVFNTLVTIENVQFDTSELGTTYADPVGQQTVNKTLIDTQGTTIELRNSGYASFAGELLPEGSGSITVVLSGYDTNVNGTVSPSEYQLYIRDTNDVVFDQPRFGGGSNDQEATNFLFSGADFENWNNFLASLNSFGLTDGLAIQSPGTGRDGSNSFFLNGTTGSTNPYVFTVLASASTVPTNPTKITMWIKGSAAKSLSFNLDTTGGRVYFNLGELGMDNVTLSPQANNQYTGAINTNGEWRLVTLNVGGLTLNTTGDLLALKAGSGTTYNLHIDNIKID